MKKRLHYLFILVILITFTCCQKNDISTSALRLDFQEGDLPSLHPHELTFYIRGLSIAKTLYEGLTRIDNNGEAKLAGAASVDISSDRLRYTFTLRNNSWSDGTPVTAFHYEQAWKEALSPTSSCPRADLLYMIKNAKEAKKGIVPVELVGVKAINDKMLVVNLAYPSPYFLELAAGPICAPLKDPKKREPTEFNGPFLVDTWKRDDYLKLKPNPHFWDNKHICLKEIDIFMIENSLSTMSLYEKDKIDWIGAPLCPLLAEQIEHLKKDNVLKTHPIDRIFWVFFNTQHPHLSSPLIRQAFSLAIDRNAITSHILVGGDPISKPLPQGLLPLPARSILKEDPLEAQNRFDEGLKQLGFTRENFPPIVITYSQQANRKQFAEYLQETWSQTFGITVRVQSEEWNVLRSNLGKGLFEVSGCFESAFYRDPLELFERFTTLNSCNFCQWIYRPFEEKIALAIQEKDPNRRMELTAEAEEILMQELPFIPISSDVLLFATHPKLKGYVFDFTGAVDFSYAYFGR